MIAIAGAKGGCGKTVTTLGITEAFARAGTTSLAIDCDRQIPDLHQYAGLDAASEPDNPRPLTDYEKIVKQNPRQENSYILPGPALPETSEYEEITAQLAQPSIQILLDCPSGAGPDVADAIAPAQAAVIVTTPQTESIHLAAKTASICRRLDVPVIGVLVNGCASVPQHVRDQFDVPIIEAIPEGSPLTDRSIKRSYDAIVTQLADVQRGKEPSPSRTTTTKQRLSTGIGPVDRTYGGGLPSGTTVALTSERKEPATAVLTRITAERQTLYVTPANKKEDVVDRLSSKLSKKNQPQIREIPEQDGLEAVTDTIEQVADNTNIVIDPVTPLEAEGRVEYLDFLNVLISRVQTSGSLAFLYCSTEASPPANRAVTERLVDMRFELQTTDEGYQILTVIPRNKHGKKEQFALELKSRY